MHLRPRLKLIASILSVVFVVGLIPGCGDMDRTRETGPLTSYSVRRFTGPGQIAQSLDERGRALIFQELASPDDGTSFEFDPAWTFEISVLSPSGEPVPTTLTPVVPRAWRNDQGVKLIGGFDAPTRGTYQVMVTSENCPPRKARMLVLPIN